MSYDVRLLINTGLEEHPIIENLNYTYNVYAMLRLAFDDERGINSIDAEPASSGIPFLRQAIGRMEDSPTTYQAMNPPNGWGSYEGCLRWLRNILSQCERHPRATVRIT